MQRLRCPQSPTSRQHKRDGQRCIEEAEVVVSSACRRSTSWRVEEAEVVVSSACRRSTSWRVVGIEYETKDGVWHEELDPGSDRPQTLVEDEK